MQSILYANTEGIVSEEALTQVMKEKIKAKYVEKNLIAFQKGKEYKQE